MPPSADAAQGNPPAQSAPEAGPAPDLRGLVDNATADRLYGWVFDAARPGYRVPVELRLGAERLASGIADLPRPDLAKNGIGDGCHAFEFAVTPQQMARRGELTVLARAADGQAFPVALRIRQHQPQPQPQAPQPAAGVAVQAQVAETRRMREELNALTNRVGGLPSAQAVQALLDQNGQVAQQLKLGIQAMDQRLALLPDNELMKQAVQQQGLLAERLAAMEVWLDRLERRLAEAPPAPAAGATAGHRLDPWQAVLFATLGLSMAVAVAVGLVLRFL